MTASVGSAVEASAARSSDGAVPVASEGEEAGAVGGEFGGEGLYLYFRVEVVVDGDSEALAEGGGGLGLAETEVSSAVPSPPPIELERDEMREPREELRRIRRSMASFTGTGLAKHSVTGSMSLEDGVEDGVEDGAVVVGWVGARRRWIGNREKGITGRARARQQIQTLAHTQNAERRIAHLCSDE